MMGISEFEQSVHAFEQHNYPEAEYYLKQTLKVLK
jgi:hypothetical protein